MTDNRNTNPKESPLHKSDTTAAHSSRQERSPVLKDVESGSDADADPGMRQGVDEGVDADHGDASDIGGQAAEPSPGEGTGQQDDNIDDLGRRPDGSSQDQPGVDIDELTENAEKLDRD